MIPRRRVALRVSGEGGGVVAVEQSVLTASLGLRSAIGRWAGLGPYYAMFPREFAFQVVAEFTRPGDAVLDPFAGRGSSVYAAAALGRQGLGIEINPVGWLYGGVKLGPGDKGRVLARLQEMGEIAASADLGPPEETGEFFKSCFCLRVLRFLGTCRDTLKWHQSKVDATLMAIILVYLHGKRSESLSNQMRQTKAMSPPYSVRWWRDKGLDPPEVDPVEFLRRRIEWRYAKGTPGLSLGQMVLGDSGTEVRRLSRLVAHGRMERFNLLFTSPPYCGVTNYHADQWLRLWMLGGPASPVSREGFSRGRFSARDQYSELLKNVFTGCAGLLEKDATIYVRTDKRPFTLEATLEALANAFPSKSVVRRANRPYSKETQTALFGDHTPKPGEVDLVLQ